VKPTVLKKKSASSAMGSSKIFSYEDTCTWLVFVRLHPACHRLFFMDSWAFLIFPFPGHFFLPSINGLWDPTWYNVNSYEEKLSHGHLSWSCIIVHYGEFYLTDRQEPMWTCKIRAVIWSNDC
jgi:hypothetical protein